MDKKLKIAYILTGIAIIGQFYFGVNHVNHNYFAAPIALVLLFLSLMGSMRARLLLLGFLLFFGYTFYLKISSLYKTLDPLLFILFLIPFLAALIAIVFIFVPINVKETASRFSEKAPLKITTAFFLLLIIWKITLLVTLPILHYEAVTRLTQKSLVFAKFLIYNLFFLALIVFVTFSLLRKKAAGYILAPIVLTAITIYRIDNLFLRHYLPIFIHYLKRFEPYRIFQTLISLFSFFKHKLDFVYNFISYLIIPVLAIPLIIFFILCLKEDTLGIVTAKLKDIRKIKNGNG